MGGKYLVIVFLFFSTKSFCQKEGNVWLFDQNLGIDFGDSRFRSFNSTVNINQGGATATMCDPSTGRLLFFTNGRTIWNKALTVMQNGTELNGGVNTDQAALIVPMPGSINRYYIFTTKSIHDPYLGGRAGLYYSVVDLTLANGLGAVTSAKNISLTQNSSDKLIAIPHANERDYWLVTHEGDSDRFVVYEINLNGIGSPQFFSFGIPYDQFKSKGWLQASPNGKMLACAVSSDGFERNPLELYDFDSETGIIYNRRELGLYAGLYGVSFSPDNTKLYFTFSDQLINRTDRFCQFDLTIDDIETIKSSRTDIYALHDPFPDLISNQKDTVSFGVLQLAPDGRLYMKAIIPYTSNEQGRIEEKLKIYFVDQPNRPGLLCEPKGRDFNASFTSPNGWSFPNLMPHYFNGLQPINNDDENTSCDESNILVYPNPVSNILNIDFTGDCGNSIEVQIFNSIGQAMLEKPLTETFYNIDLSLISDGIYFLVFKTSNEKFIKKIIKI